MKIKIVNETRKNAYNSQNHPFESNNNCVQVEFDLGGAPKGIRIPVSSLKGWCPRPLDDGGTQLRIKREGFEPRLLGKTKHYIHILDRLSSGAFNKVIDTAYNNYPAGLFVNRRIKQA